MLTTEIKLLGRFNKTGIRFLVMQAAYKCNVTGFIKREKADSLLILASGKSTDVEKFIVSLQTGYIGSKLDSLEQMPLPYKNEYKYFDIID